MKREFHPMLLVAAAFTVVSSLHAKRFPPKPVPPIQIGNVMYSVPHGALMGFVVATDFKSKTELWQRQIYTVWAEPELEGDVQDVFISGIKQLGGKLLVTNEKGYEYELDLNSLLVRPIKGTIVVKHRSK